MLALYITVVKPLLRDSGNQVSIHLQQPHIFSNYYGNVSTSDKGTLRCDLCPCAWLYPPVFHVLFGHALK